MRGSGEYREANVERRLREKVWRELHGVAYKFTSPERRSVPDRLCLLPGGRAVFVECKARGRKTTDAQDREILRLRSLGFTVYVVDSYAAVDEVIAALAAEGADEETWRMLL